jgi:hypothetical protein
MNTIQINTEEGTVNYTESEVIRFIERAKEVDAVQQRADKHWQEVRDIRYKVRDFFSECEWIDGETTINKGDVNLLLDSIGTDKLTSKYTGTFTVNGTFSVEAEDEETATGLLTDGINVEFYDGDIDVDSIDIDSIEEDN